MTTTKGKPRKTKTTTSSQVKPDQSSGKKSFWGTIPGGFLIGIGAIVLLGAIVLFALGVLTSVHSGSAQTVNRPAQAQSAAPANSDPVKTDTSLSSSGQNANQGSGIEAAQSPAQPAQSGGTGNLDFYGSSVDLSNPIELPPFVTDPAAWKAMTPANRQAAVSKALGVTAYEIADEPGVAYAFNGDGIDLTDMPLIKGLFYEVHLADNSIVYFAEDAGNLSDYDEATGDATVRIAYFLRGEISANGALCLPYWNSVKYNTMYDRVPIALGYFNDQCLPIPDRYVSQPTLVETFHMLLRVTGTDLTRMGERPGVWYFRSSLGKQDMTCPQGWVCYGTTDPASGNQVFSEFTGTTEGLTGAYIFDTVADGLNDVQLTDEDVTNFLRDYSVSTK